MRLCALGEFDEATIREEQATLRRQRSMIENWLQALRPPTPVVGCIDERALTRACATVGRWLDEASYEDCVLALDALQVAVQATKGQASMAGVLPQDPPSFLTEEESCRCSSSGR
jgi:hypothetical protein